MIKKTPLSALYFIMLSALIFSACTKKETISTLLEDRVGIRWKALIVKDWKKAYSFETPGFKKTYSINSYINSFGDSVSWHSANFLSSQKITDSTKDVKIEITFTLTGTGNSTRIPTIITERWLKVENTWYHVKND